MLASEFIHSYDLRLIEARFMGPRFETHHNQFESDPTLFSVTHRWRIEVGRNEGRAIVSVEAFEWGQGDGHRVAAANGSPADYFRPCPLGYDPEAPKHKHSWPTPKGWRRDREGHWAPVWGQSLTMAQARTFEATYCARPTLPALLECLALDAGCIQHSTLSDFAEEFGYDDTGKAREVREAIEAQCDRLVNLLGRTGFRELLDVTEDE